MKWWHYPGCAVLWAVYIVFCAVAFIPMLILAVWIKPGDGSHYADYYAKLEKRT